MSRKHRSVPFYQSKPFLAVSALLGLAAVILGIVTGVIPLLAPKPVFDNAEFVVDSSQAMLGDFGGMPKIAAVSDAVRGVVQAEGLQKSNLALRTFGGVCGQPALKPLLDFHTGNDSAITSHLQSLTASGESNLVDTLLQAISDFGDEKRFSDNVTKRIIVITGGPDGCRGDAAAVQKKLADFQQANRRLQMDFHFIGVGLNDTGVATLNDLATKIGGSVALARNREELRQVVRRVVVVEPVIKAGAAVTTILNGNVHSLNGVIDAANRGDNAEAKRRLVAARAAFDDSELPFRDLAQRQTTPAYKEVYKSASDQRELQKKMLDEADALLSNDRTTADTAVKTFNANSEAYNIGAKAADAQLQRIASQNAITH